MQNKIKKCEYVNLQYNILQNSLEIVLLEKEEQALY